VVNKALGALSMYNIITLGMESIFESKNKKKNKKTKKKTLISSAGGTHFFGKKAEVLGI
jgi:alpha/beta superfamily hydrolase